MSLTNITIKETEIDFSTQNQNLDLTLETKDTLNIATSKPSLSITTYEKSFTFTDNTSDPLFIDATKEPIAFSVEPKEPTLVDIAVGLNLGNSSLNLIDNEIPIGPIDGSNATFNTEFFFYPESLKVYLNGERLNHGIGNDFSILNANTFILFESPVVDDILIVDYSRSS
jgi:hypothetical protein